MAQISYMAGRPLSKVGKGFVEMVVPKFKLNDFAVTLTFSEDHIPDPQHRSTDIRNYLRRVNGGLLGGNRFKKGERLKCASVFEMNACGTAIHLHMILENPTVGRIAEQDRLPYLLDEWMAMRCSGSRAANDVQLVDDVGGWASYMFKCIKPHNAYMADVENWKL